MITISTDKPIVVQVSDGCGHHLYDAYLPADSSLKIKTGSFVNISPDVLSHLRKFEKK